MSGYERMPADYKRDLQGRVSAAEFNRYLPRWRCSTCGQWLFGAQLHTVKDCARRVRVSAGTPSEDA
jgi:hypothetical protein